MPEPSTDSSGGAGLGGRDLIGLGGLLVGAVVVGTVLGILIDRAADTSPVFTMLGVFLGIAAAGIGFWLRVRSAMRT
jgi:F0F1-type ATP synthase assembly protein I